MQRSMGQIHQMKVVVCGPIPLVEEIPGPVKAGYSHLAMKFTFLP
jgi:hypothetical protein